MSARRARLTLLGLLGASIAAFLIATLTPGSPTAPRSGPWCLWCGAHGTLDMGENLLVLLPAGTVAAWLRMRMSIVLITALALATSVELVQYFLISGRDGTVSDVLMNVLGAALGHRLAVTHFRALRPAPERATVQIAVALLGWLLVVAMAGVALRPDVPHPPFALIPAVVDSTSPFRGELLSASIDGWQLEPNEIMRAPELRDLLRANPSSVVMTVRPGPPTRVAASIARLGSPQATPVSFAQHGRAFVCTRRMAATRFRVLTPSFVLQNAFPAHPPSPSSTASPVELTCTRDGTSMRLRAAGSDGMREATVSLSPGLGWSLVFSGHVAADATSLRWTNALWMLSLALPVGLYAAEAARRRVGEAAGVTTISTMAPVAAMVVATLVTSHIVVPRIVGVAPASWIDVASSVMGLALGASANTVLARRTGRAARRHIE